MAATSSSSDKKTRVYVWDMDETLILLKSLLNGTYADAFTGSKDVRKGEEIGKMWETLILDLCDRHFFYEQIENFNEPYLEALNQFDDGRDLSGYEFHKDGFSTPNDDSNKRKLAYRLRAVSVLYEQGLEKIFDEKTKEHWDELYEITDKYTDGWLSSARCFLEQCSSKTGSNNTDDFESINVLVTSGSLVPSIAKCLLFRFDTLIKHVNVYSSWEVGKVQCFQWIKKRFDGPSFQFCAIGDGWEECEAAEAMKWPFVQIDPRPSGPNRFPGLTLRTVGYYFSVVYGNRDTAIEEED